MIIIFMRGGEIMENKFQIEVIDSIVAPAWYDPSSWSTPVKVVVIVTVTGLALT